MSAPLREAALARARAFVALHGSELDRLRMDALLERCPGDAVRGALEALQGADGSFALAPGRAATAAFESTLRALRVLADLRVRRCAAVERAVGFLSSLQRDDGSWGESPEPAERIAPTGFVGGELARSVYTRPAVLAAAGAFLGPRAPAALGDDAPFETLAALAAFFANAPHDGADAALQRLGRAFEHGFRARAFSALRAARILTLCEAQGVPGARVEPAELVTGMLAEQAADGGWPAEPGEERVAQTLEAALALLRLPA